MYGMTAAHKTLPLPAYVRVTNLQNGRSVVVRVNDRGPFVGNRIIDLSYTAAAKLDMLRNGTAMVEVRAIDPLGRAACRHRRTAGGACRMPAAPRERDAVRAGRRIRRSRPMRERLAAKLRGGRYGKVFVRDDQIAGRRMYRVRIGPVPRRRGIRPRRRRAGARRRPRRAPRARLARSLSASSARAVR